MRAIFSLEDSFNITGRGVVITGRAKVGKVEVGDIIIIEGNQVRIIGIEQFRGTFGKGQNIGILLGTQVNLEDMKKLRGSDFEITDKVEIRDDKLDQLGI